MKGITGGLLALTALALISVGDIAAQEAIESRPERSGMRGNASAERIMSMRDRLELSEEQIASLEAIRAEDVERSSIAQAEMAEMRSRMMAGQIRRSEMMAFMEDRQEGFANTGDAQRQRVEGILTAGQLESLGTMREEAQASQRGRASGRAGGRAGMQRGARHGARGSRSTMGSRGWNRGPGGAMGGRGFMDGRGARGSRSMMRGRAPGGETPEGGDGNEASEGGAHSDSSESR